MISQLNKKFAKTKVICYDMETKTCKETGKQIFILGVVISDGKLSRTFFNVDKMFEYILQECKKKTKNVIFAHQANFDFSLFNYKLLDNYMIRSFSTNPFYIMFKDYSKRYDIIFLDSLNFFKSSLAEIGKTFNLEKLEIDFDNCTLEELEIYCVRDTDIVYKAINFIRQKCIDYDIPFPVTIAQFAYNYFRKYFLKEAILNPDRIDIMQLERDSYFGGRVEVFDFNKVLCAYVYDINSLYPYVMKNNKVPISVDSYLGVNYCNNNQNYAKQIMKEYLRTEKLFIARVSLNLNESYIGKVPFRTENRKLTFPYGKFKTTLCSSEIELVKDNVEFVHEIVSYNSEYIFTDYVNENYDSRKIAQSEKDTVLDLFYKLLLNSLYGKFAQRKFSFKAIPELDDPDFNFGELGIIVNDIKYDIKYFNGKAFIQSVEPLNKRVFVAISSFITSYARIELYKELEKHKDTLLYCDTDSIFIKDDNPLLEVGKELGQWKKEKQYYRFFARGNKAYQWKYGRKIKGLGKDAKEISRGVFQLSRITKIKESIRRFKEPTARLITFTKEFSSDYDKRVVNKDKTTEQLYIT